MRSGRSKAADKKTPPKTRTVLGRLVQSVTMPAPLGSNRLEKSQKAIVGQSKNKPMDRSKRFISPHSTKKAKGK